MLKKLGLPSFQEFRDKINFILSNLTLPYNGKIYKIEKNTLSVYSSYTRTMEGTDLPLYHQIILSVRDDKWYLALKYRDWFRQLLKKLFQVNGVEFSLSPGGSLILKEETELGISYSNIESYLGDAFYKNKHKIIDIFKISINVLTQGEYIGHLIKVYSPGAQYGDYSIYCYNGKYYKMGNIVHGFRYFLGINLKEISNKTSSKLIEEAICDLDSIKKQGYYLSK